MPPGFTEAVLGAADNVKLGPETVNVTLVDCVSEPLVPVRVSVELPVGVLPVVLTVNVELPDVVIEAGLKENVVPAGKPLALRLTEPVNPPSAPMFTV